MFEGIDLYEIRYSTNAQANSLAGIQLESPDAVSQESVLAGQIYLKDCSFVLDGLSRVCQFFPISAMAREHFLYVQSFSYWEAGLSYFTKRKALDSFLLVYTYEGSGELEVDGRKHVLDKGDVFLIDCRELHQYRTLKAPWKHSVLHFNGVSAAPLFHSFAEQNDVCLHLDAGAEYQRQLERLLRSLTTIHPYREYQVSALLTNLLLFVLTSSDSYKRAQQNMPDQIREIAYYLNRHYAREFSVDELAASFSISKYHLCRSFKKYTGFTLNEYVTQLRLERAKELLRTTTLPANKIGNLVGFADENYFYRLFRKHTGQTPHKYRKSTLLSN
ncbi:MAG: helix-turn-helix transcriptional regulator [Firmicutes bacterium]|nr:helix-turn-helix transcriptional regulator [Bacillota bacterium]